MGVRIIRKGKTCRRWWYGEYRDGGKLCRIKLDVRVSGKPPSTFSTKDEGDTLFEASKAKAQKAFDDFMLSRQQKGNAEGLLESLIAAKTGEKVSYVRLSALSDLWNGHPFLSATVQIMQRPKEPYCCLSAIFAILQPPRTTDLIPTSTRGQ